jgi:hypothetical protein
MTQNCLELIDHNNKGGLLKDPVISEIELCETIQNFFEIIHVLKRRSAKKSNQRINS